VNERTAKALSFAAAAFGAISTLVQVAWMGWTASGITLVGTLLCVLFFMRSYRRARAHRTAVEALSALALPPSNGPGFEVRNLNSVEELRELWKIDDENYGESSISFELFRSWWRAYPCGLYAIFDSQKIVGGLGLWPLKKKTFDEFVEGRRKESEITDRGICRVISHAVKDRWYFSGIVLTKRLRRSQAVATLLETSLSNWIAQLGPTPCVNLAALAYTSEGENMLRRFGFSCYRERTQTLDRLPIYARFNVGLREIDLAVRRIAAISEPAPGRSSASTRAG